MLRHDNVRHGMSSTCCCCCCCMRRCKLFGPLASFEVETSSDREFVGGALSDAASDQRCCFSRPVDVFLEDLALSSELVQIGAGPFEVARGCDHRLVGGFELICGPGPGHLEGRHAAGIDHGLGPTFDQLPHALLGVVELLLLRSNVAGRSLFFASSQREQSFEAFHEVHPPVAVRVP